MLPAAVDAAAPQILTALAAQGLDPSYAAFVARHVAVPDGEWRWCCGSHCDPCVQRLGRAVDDARASLGISPPGLPGAAETA